MGSGHQGSQVTLLLPARASLYSTLLFRKLLIQLRWIQAVRKELEQELLSTVWLCKAHCCGTRDLSYFIAR